MHVVQHGAACQSEVSNKRLVRGDREETYAHRRETAAVLALATVKWEALLA
jgi:hypothetical protein